MAMFDGAIIMEEDDKVDVRLSEWPGGDKTTHIYFGDGALHALRVRGKKPLLRLIAALTSAEQEQMRLEHEAEEFHAEKADA